METYFKIKLIEEYAGLIIMGIVIVLFIAYVVLSVIYDKICNAWKRRK